MTTNEITQSARRKLLETSTEVLSDTTVLLYANLAYVDVWKRVFTANAIDSATVSFTAGVGTLPATFGRLYGSAKDASDNFYQELSVADFERAEFDYGVTIENGTIKVYPTDTASLTIKYYPVPETLTTSQNPTIDSYFHEPIVYGIMWRAHEELQDEELSTYYREKFKADLDERLAYQSSYEEANQRGGQMFVEQNLIGGGPTYF